MPFLLCIATKAVKSFSLRCADIKLNEVCEVAMRLSSMCRSAGVVKLVCIFWEEISLLRKWPRWHFEIPVCVCVCVCACVWCVLAHARTCRSGAVRQACSLVGQWFAYANLFYVSAPFELVVINSRTSKSSLTAVVTKIFSIGLLLSSDKQFGEKNEFPIQIQMCVAKYATILDAPSRGPRNFKCRSTYV
jgi:hypothetical protein